MGPVAELALEFLRATEAAAIAAGRMRGCGDNKAADAAAVTAMRAIFDTIAFDGRVAIGEASATMLQCFGLASLSGHAKGTLGRWR